MQNIHTHAWNARLHFAPETILEADISRGYPLDLTVQLDSFLADNSAFEKVVVFGLKGRLTGYWVPDEYIAEFVSHDPERLIGLAACDPTQAGYMQELKVGLEEYKLSGVKIGPIYAGLDPRDPACFPVYDYCQENGFPIFFHTGTTFNRLAPLGTSRPWLWDAVAIRYPDLRIVMAHCGHPFTEECLVVIRKHPHVYADISALFYRPWQFYNTLIAAQEYRVVHKLLFGTDYPFARAEESLQGLQSLVQVGGKNGLPVVSQAAVDEILHRDSCSLLFRRSG